MASTSHPHIRPRRPGGGLESLDKIVRSLNEDYGLDIEGPNSIRPPSVQLGLADAPAQKSIQRIYARLEKLHGKNALSEKLVRFRIQAEQVIRGWVYKPLANVDTLPQSRRGAPLGARCEKERAELRQCLYNILRDRSPTSMSTRTHRPCTQKRTSDEYHEGPSKRTRSLCSEDESNHSIDHVPVRSKESGPGLNPLLHRISSRSLGTTTSANSSRESLQTDVFSFVEPTDTPFSTQNTDPEHKQVQEDKPLALDGMRLSQEFDPGSQDIEALNESFSRFEQGEDTTHCELHVPPIGSAGPSFSTSPRKPSSLGHLWPKFPYPKLTHAPLPVAWEIVRAAANCGVDLDHFDMEYNPEEEIWSDQKKFWGMLSDHRLFLNKGMPAKSEASCWQASLRDFQIKNNRCISLEAELVPRTTPDGSRYQMKLRPLTSQMSCRLERRFGSDRFLKLIIPAPSRMNAADAEDLCAWLHGDHHFLGRIWKAFYSSPLKTPASPSLSDKTPKDPTDNRQKKHYDYQERVYFFAVDGNHFRPPEDPTCPIPPADEALTPQCRTKMSYADFLDWAISARGSSEQPFLKLFSRIALGLSKTDPTVVLEPGQIYHKEKDLLSPTGAVMNDGIARMSRALARKVAECLNLDELPSSFQGRFGSAKGMWIVDVHDDGLDQSIWIETYPSQRKWNCDFQDPHHRTFEVRSYSKELRPANLNQQFIPILTHQSKDPIAVKKTIVKCIETGLCADLAELRDAIPDSRDLLLWLQRAGFMSTFSRQSQGQIPYLGGVPDDEGQRACATLLSGFDAKCQYTSNLFWKMAERKADDLKRSMKIQLPCSAYAYMVIDFDGILAPDEIHLSFSTKFQAGDFSDTNIEGMDVLVGRSPAHFPSDIQRVRAVSKPELRRLKDVVVFPSTGDTPLADLLSGGDYDGDMAWVCWDQSIVGSFQNADPPPKYDFVEEGYLTKNRARFADIVQGRDGDMDKACEDFQIEGLSFAMEPSLLGIGTKYKEKLTYWTNSVDSEQAMLMSSLLGELVDQKKSGTTFTEDNWLRFRQERLQCPKTYGIPEYEKERASDAWRKKLPKDKHVLDYIKFDVAETALNRALKDVHAARMDREPQPYDRHVCQMYREWERIARGSTTRKSVMDTLRADLHDLEKKWIESRNDNMDFRERVTLHYERWVKIAPPVRVRGNSVVKQLKGLHDRFVPLGVDYYQTLDDDDWTAPFSCWSLLKASTTFLMFYSKRQDFAWYMAGKQILALKAKVISNKPEYQRSSASTVVPYIMPLLKPDGKAIAKLAAKRKAAAAESDLEDKVDEVEDWDEVGTVIDDC